MARLRKEPDAAETAVAEHVAAVVAADPRGAPITMSEPPSYEVIQGEDRNGGYCGTNPDYVPQLAPEAAPLDDVSAFVAPEAGPRCALDDAPIHSHLVILQWPGEKAEVVLQTPAGQIDVPASDLAWKLPLMAEIKKTGPNTYVAIQRDDATGKPKLVCATAVEACQQFKKHFHGERD